MLYFKGMLNIRNNRQMKSLTGLTKTKMAEIEPIFDEVYKEHQQRAYEEGSETGNRQRKPGGGRKGVLKTSSDKLVFILYYLKTYPTFDQLAEKFDLSRSNAHANVYKLIPILAETLVRIGAMPKREFGSVEEFKAEFEGIEEIIIDKQNTPKDNL